MASLSYKDGQPEGVHEVVLRYGKVEGRFHGKELFYVETVHAEVILKFFYPIFCFSPFPVKISHRFCRKREICH